MTTVFPGGYEAFRVEIMGSYNQILVGPGPMLRHLPKPHGRPQAFAQSTPLAPDTYAEPRWVANPEPLCSATLRHIMGRDGTQQIGEQNPGSVPPNQVIGYEGIRPEPILPRIGWRPNWHWTKITYDYGCWRTCASKE
nr:hypothetical protein Iba_chr09fCG9220 [Ipomoea batatas]